MRRLPIVIMLGLLAATVLGQQATAAKCPRFTITASTGIPRDGQIVPFYVRWADPLGDLRPQYNWRVVGAGELIGGQGTMIAEIKVFSGRNFTVTVDISSLPAGCQNTASETGSIDLAPTPTKLDEYAGPLTRIPKVRLEVILKAVKENPGSNIYVVLSGGRSHSLRAIANKRKVLVRDLFSEFVGNPPVTVVEHLNTLDDKLLIWLVPPGATPPYR